MPEPTLAQAPIRRAETALIAVRARTSLPDELTPAFPLATKETGHRIGQDRHKAHIGSRAENLNAELRGARHRIG